MNLYDGFDVKYRKEIENIKAKIAYYEAIEEWKHGKKG